MYFDNAATSYPKPEAVYRAVDGFLRTSAANPGRSGHGMAVRAEGVIAGARHSLARLLNAPHPERLVFTPNGTAALNLALKGLLRPGDHVVTTSLEHNSVARPLYALERDRNVRVTRVPCPGGVPDIAALLGALEPGTRLVAMVHVSNVTGAVLPVEEVAAECRRRGVALLIDAAQSAGTLPIDVRALGPLALVAMPGHKGLYGPPGTGALYIGDDLDLAPLVQGGTGSLSEQEEQPPRLPGRYESGTLNSAGIAGLGAGVEWILDQGVETIRRHETALAERLREGLAGCEGVTFYSPPRSAPSSAVVSFNLDGWEPTDVAQILDTTFGIQCRPGLHCAPWAHRSIGTFPGGTVRLSPGFFNTEDEVDEVVSAVREIGGGL